MAPARIDPQAWREHALRNGLQSLLLAIRSIPTLVLFRGGREVARQAGAQGAAEIVRWARVRR